MGLINDYKIRQLERKIERWKKEGQWLLTELHKTNTQAREISDYCISALDDLNIVYRHLMIFLLKRRVEC